jgi:hypothetical protein
MSQALSTPTPLTVLSSYSPQLLNVLLANLTEQEQAELAEILEVDQNRHLWEQMEKRESGFDRGPLLWLTQYTNTEDTHWLDKGTPFRQPFPAKSYLECVMKYLLTERSVFLPKSREMMMSWTVSGYIAWMCQWYPVFWVAQTGKEDKVAELIQYARTLVNNQPDWMKRKNPLVVDNELELKWASGGRFLGVPKGEDQIRIHHPYGYFQDESAFLPEAQQAYDAVRPVCKQTICVSTDEIGWFHNECKLEG